MRKELSGTPTLEPDAFLWRIRDWKSLLAGPGNNRIVVEWCVTNGPKCFVYPAAQRSAGFDLCAEAPHDTSDERWADWLERGQNMIPSKPIPPNDIPGLPDAPGSYVLQS